MLYAIGEILLVVIGFLIGLQITMGLSKGAHYEFRESL